MKKFNLNEFIWFGILIGFTYFVAQLFIKGTIAMYVHPKMFKYVFFAMLVFVVLALYQVKRIWMEQENKRLRRGYGVFILPLMLALVVNPEGVSSEIVAKKGIRLASSGVETSMGVKSLDVPIEKVGVAEEPDEALDLKTSPSDDEGDSNREVEDLDSVHYMNVLNEIYTAEDSMVGQRIDLVGFVFWDEDFGPNQFVVSRLVMSCCAADAQLVGVLSQVEGERYDNDQWVRVSGVVELIDWSDVYTGNHELLPVIRVETVEKVQEPQNPYMYP